MKHLTSKKITNVKNDVQGQGICFCSSCTLTCEGGCGYCDSNFIIG